METGAWHFLLCDSLYWFEIYVKYRKLNCCMRLCGIIIIIVYSVRQVVVYMYNEISSVSCSLMIQQSCSIVSVCCPNLDQYNMIKHILITCLVKYWNDCGRLHTGCQTGFIVLHLQHLHPASLLLQLLANCRLLIGIWISCMHGYTV